MHYQLFFFFIREIQASITQINIREYINANIFLKKFCSKSSLWSSGLWLDETKVLLIDRNDVVLNWCKDKKGATLNLKTTIFTVKHSAGSKCFGDVFQTVEEHFF